MTNLAAAPDAANPSDSAPPEAFLRPPLERYTVEMGDGAKRPWLVRFLLKNSEWLVVSSHVSREKAEETAARLNADRDAMAA